MAFGVLIAFRLAKYDKNRASELVKRLYGQRTSSHGGQYVYRRMGLVDEIPHRRLIRGVLILRRGDEERVLELLRELGAEVHVRQVKLTEEDSRALSPYPECRGILSQGARRDLDHASRRSIEG